MLVCRVTYVSFALPFWVGQSSKITDAVCGKRVCLKGKRGKTLLLLSKEFLILQVSLLTPESNRT